MKNKESLEATSPVCGDKKIMEVASPATNRRKVMIEAEWIESDAGWDRETWFLHPSNQIFSMHYFGTVEQTNEGTWLATITSQYMSSKLRTFKNTKEEAFEAIERYYTPLSPVVSENETAKEIK